MKIIVDIDQIDALAGLISEMDGCQDVARSNLLAQRAHGIVETMLGDYAYMVYAPEEEDRELLS